MRKSITSLWLILCATAIAAVAATTAMSTMDFASVEPESSTTSSLTSPLSADATAAAEDAEDAVVTAPPIKITFAGRGESLTVDRVLVENLSNGQSTSLNGCDTLVLKENASESGINDIVAPDADGIIVRDGQLRFNMSQPKDVQVAVYSMNGSLMWQTSIEDASGNSSIQLPSLDKGLYIVRAVAPGFSKSIKWLCNSASSNNSFSLAAEAEAEAADAYTEPITRTAAYAASSAPKNVELRYVTGDVLRFTGTSGVMTTITTSSPLTSHPIHFDFFKCQDADGYNYAIVRAGDLLWMSEDLRKVNNSEITNANSLSADVLNALLNNSDVSLVGTDGDQAYYSKAAAIKAMPEGWRLPTQGELDYAINKLNGGNYSTAGKWLKASGFDVDSTSICLGTKGRYNGNVEDDGNGYLMTRSTKGGVMLAMEYSDESDQVEVNTLQGYLIPVRGVRAAPSNYTEMMESFGYVEKPKAMARVQAAQPMKYGPLGKTYTMYDIGQSIAYDFSGGQYNSAYLEPRSGVLFKEKGTLDWSIHDTRDHDFLSDAGDDVNNVQHNVLRKMAAMKNGRGTQNIVEMQWSRPFRIRTRRDSLGIHTFGDSADVFSRAHEDGVYITITGDASENYAVKNKQTENGMHYGFYLDLGAYIKPLPASVLGFQSWHTNTHKRNEARMDYLMRVFQLLTADFNEDGVDELIIGIDGEIWVYDGAAILNALETNSINGTYTGKPLYHMSADESFVKNAVSKTTTRIAVGDVNADGIPDLAVFKAANNGSLYVYSAGDLDSEPIISCDKLKNTEYCTIFIDIEIGNVTGGKYNDIVLMRRNYWNEDDPGYPGFYNNFVGVDMYMYDSGEEGNLKRNNLFNAHDGCARSGDLSWFWVANANITLAHLLGREKPCDVIVGAELWRYNENTGKMEKKFNVLPFMAQSPWWTIYADNIIAADPSGDGYDRLYYLLSLTEGDGTNAYVFQTLGETWFSDNIATEGRLNNNFNLNSDIMKYCNKGNKYSSSAPLNNLELMWWYKYNGYYEWGHTGALCAVNARKGPQTQTFRYKSYQKAFSEPRIHALIAAPPIYTYGPDEIEPNYDFVTQWGYSRNSSQQTINSSSISSKFIVGFEAEINAPITGTKLGGIDFTMAMQSECASSSGKTSSISFSQYYEARDDNRVVMQVTPYDTYTYEVIEAENIDQLGNELTLSIPGQTMTVGLALRDYEYLMADTKGAPRLRQLFKHTIGDPFSYPRSNEDIHTNVKGSTIMWGNGRWDDWVTTGSGGSVIREISLDESTSESASFSFSVETELVGTVMGVKAGAGFGYGNTNETTHEEGQGFTVSACVPGLAPNDNSGRTFFDWNMCWYKYTLNGQTFPVVNYIVKKR